MMHRLLVWVALQRHARGTFKFHLINIRGKQPFKNHGLQWFAITGRA
jgi:hypothetical protein